MIKNKLLKRSLWALLVLFLLMNVVAAFHAYKFTHFSSSNQAKTKSAKQLSVFDKIKVVFTGINNPRPANKKLPELPYRTLVLKSNKLIECWEIKATENKGTVAIFHGYSGCKATMLDKAYEFLKLGYNVLLVDFMGAGGSEGYQCSIGYHEAEQVKTVNDYLITQHQKQIILFGTSMGAAAILRAVSQYSLQTNALILECPFGSMLQTVGARFKTMHVPAFPMANLLVFWGGVENQFNAFAHNPTTY
ncbi:MAG: alpha/beta hydrolase, partial [Bacteroidia bacterium]|nr:alpha/beta hydrolase [Bacteroidia bacterium]